MATGPLFWALKARVRTVVKPRAGRNPNPEPRPNALDKLVLITIADQASEVEGWSALLPLWFVADRAECTERAARESVRRLEAAGLLRCRDVVLEGSEASAWRRYYLLAPESPVTQGVLEISWDEPEQIRRAAFERHRAVVLSRHEDGGERPAKKRTSCPQPPEPGSGGEPDPRNLVPPLYLSPLGISSFLLPTRARARQSPPPARLRKEEEEEEVISPRGRKW